MDKAEVDLLTSFRVYPATSKKERSQTLSYKDLLAISSEHTLHLGSCRHAY